MLIIYTLESRNLMLRLASSVARHLSHSSYSFLCTRNEKHWHLSRVSCLLTDSQSFNFRCSRSISCCSFSIFWQDTFITHLLPVRPARKRLLRLQMLLRSLLRPEWFCTRIRPSEGGSAGWLLFPMKRCSFRERT